MDTEKQLPDRSEILKCLVDRDLLRGGLEVISELVDFIVKENAASFEEGARSVSVSKEFDAVLLDRRRAALRLYNNAIVADMGATILFLPDDVMPAFLREQLETGLVSAWVARVTIEYVPNDSDQYFGPLNSTASIGAPQNAVSPNGGQEEALHGVASRWGGPADVVEIRGVMSGDAVKVNLRVASRILPADVRTRVMANEQVRVVLTVRAEDEPGRGRNPVADVIADEAESGFGQLNSEKAWDQASSRVYKGPRTWGTNLLDELKKYLDMQVITSENIGEIRESCFVPWDSEWNGTVRQETAKREVSGQMSTAENLAKMVADLANDNADPQKVYAQALSSFGLLMKRIAELELMVIRRGTNKGPASEEHRANSFADIVVEDWNREVEKLTAHIFSPEGEVNSERGASVSLNKPPRFDWENSTANMKAVAADLPKQAAPKERDLVRVINLMIEEIPAETETIIPKLRNIREYAEQTELCDRHIWWKRTREVLDEELGKVAAPWQEKVRQIFAGELGL